ncbi:MAG: outer membrane protein assembly factor BamA [Hyphomicrobiaceae bacterium]|nr:outer membrane protein assembly factor BamA [Hyphomicrobiaceae bacterium]
MNLQKTKRWGMELLLALSLAVPLLAMPGTMMGATQVEAATIRKISVVGNRRVEVETVLSYLQFVPGDRYDAGRVDDSLKSLFATGLFSDVNIRRKGSKVVVKVVENPIVNKVAFEGNSEIDNKTLASEIQLKPRSVFTRARVRSDTQRVLDVYQRQGLFAANVEPKIIRIAHNRVNLVFEINEGSKTTVKSINFIGNRAFTDPQLRDIVTTSETGLFSFMSSSNIYDPDRLNLDRELLRQYYIKNGYADARVISAVADLAPDGQNFFITFTIDEGELYRFGNIDLETSLASLDPETMRDKITTFPGEIYNASKISKTAEAITLTAAEAGFAFARVRPSVHRDPLARTIDINYVVEQGPRVYIERIDITGNTRTKDYVIRREFKLVEGDAYNKLMVKRAKQRLQGLGFLKKVEVKRSRGSAPDRVVLNVAVVEDNSGELGFSAGYSSTDGPIGDVSITERNLMGKGQFLQLKLKGSLNGKGTINLSFTEPRFLGQNLAAGFDVYHSISDLSSTLGYEKQETGGKLRLTMPLNDETRLSTYYRFARREITAVNFSEITNLASDGIVDGDVDITSAVGYGLVYDKRNHFRKPTRGVYLSASQEFAGIGGDKQYIRSVLEGRAYYPITETITFASRLRGGHISGWGNKTLDSGDGYTNFADCVRGYEAGGFGARSNNGLGSAVGTEAYACANVEVRFPFPFIPDNLGLSGAVFADAGMMFDPVQSAGVLKDDTIRASVGAGVLWDSPMGPLRVDFAYALNDKVTDRTQVFSFGASSKF